MPSQSNMSRMSDLAATIQTSVAKLQQVLLSMDTPSPSFEEDAMETLPDDTIDIRDTILDATSELYDLLLDPLTLLFQKGGHNNMVCLQAISSLGIASIVPSGGQVTFEEISKEVGLNEHMVKRILRHAMTMRVFREPVPGMVAHTKVSKVLTKPYINDWMRTATEDVWPTATKMVEAARTWPASEEPNQTGFTLVNNTTRSIYEVFGIDKEKAMRFSNAMKAFTSSPAFDISYILDHFDWASLGYARVIDIGGSQGHVAIELVQRFSNLSVIVQDLQAPVAGALVPEGLEGRLEFMAHDFFESQPIHADVYYYRWVFHNWSDKYCILILRALIPSLRTGASIVIQDACLPELGSKALWREKDLRSADLNMGAMFNGRERSASEWKDLFASADPRFVLEGIIEPKGSALAIIHAVWNDTCVT
ncbi:O-methyltransferase-domain-containing protein [Hypoxylon cercidicola]|nr:O-methyltransferase-domain-containing protein [Hypoxylon cercidicola]